MTDRLTVVTVTVTVTVHTQAHSVTGTPSDNHRVHTPHTRLGTRRDLPGCGETVIHMAPVQLGKFGSSAAAGS